MPGSGASSRVDSKIRLAVNAATAITAVVATLTNAHELASVPAVKACTVAMRNSGKLAKCTARQARLGRRRRASEVSSTASSR